MTAPISCDLKCAKCDGIAATFTVLAAGDTENSTLVAQDRLVRTRWAGKMTMPMAWERGVMIVEKLRSGGVAELQQKDWDTYAFHCPTCAKTFCTTCWTWGTPVFDEGFYDCTYGWCPAGHKQTLDD